MAAGNPRAALRRRKSKVERCLYSFVTCCSGREQSDFVSRSNCPNRISWDEAGIKKDMGERGVLYGTQTIPDASTPFLLYDSQMSRAEQAVMEINENGKAQVDIVALQARLGILQQQQEDGGEVVPRATRHAAIDEENRRRREAGAILRGNADRAAAAADEDADEPADAGGSLADNPKAFGRRRLECSAGAAMAFKAGIAKNAMEEEEDSDEDGGGGAADAKGGAAQR
mmetsp:Transcript_30976/g.89510  ORF Transcript_30976/g.89510 Transcript_30976/m.89510 type:complete len:228 (+) Transcript_30976:101-784(+)